MVSTGVPSLDNLLGSDGYPDRSTVLLVGAPGVGKEALGYWFAYSGLSQGDFCLYITTLTTRQVIKDSGAFGISYEQRVPLWIASSGGQVKLDVNDLPGLSFNIKDILKKNSDRRIRIVSDVLSPLLMLHQPETIYRFLSQLFDEIRQRDVVFLATLEDGMHLPQVNTAMERLFDGVLELRIYEEGLRFVPLLRLRKMLGVPPQPGYFNFSFTRNGMEISSYVK